MDAGKVAAIAAWPTPHSLATSTSSAHNALLPLDPVEP
jgi:hypothetical protein